MTFTRIVRGNLYNDRGGASGAEFHGAKREKLELKV